MAEKRVVAVGDLLGFTRTVLSTPLDVVMDGPVTFLMKALRHSAHREDWPWSKPTAQDLRSQKRVGLAWFSDTVLLYALDDSDEAAANVVETAAWLLYETFHASSTRMRIGVDYGEIHIDEVNGLYVGSALVHAYQLEEAQDWTGGALTQAAGDRLVGTGAEPWIVKYSVPLKEECEIVADHAINWVYTPHLTLPMAWSPRNPEPTDEDFARYPTIVPKWRNTKAFHDAVCESCRMLRTGA